MLLENSALVPQLSRHTICFSANIDHHYSWGLECTQNSWCNNEFEVLQDRKLGDEEDLENLWHVDINYFGRKFIKGWVVRGVNRWDISFNEFKSFLYLIQMSGSCNFAKRDEIYNKVIITSPESMGGYILSRKRFNLIIIAWHYVNQAYFRRKDPNSYLQIPTFFRIDASVIKRFEGYYQVRLKHIGVVL